MAESLAARWAAVVEAVKQELTRPGLNRDDLLDHDFNGLRLRARRPLSGTREEWVTVNLTREEVLNRPPAELAREFARAYHACT